MNRTDPGGLDAKTAAEEDKTRQTVRDLVKQLDDPKYEVRRKATEELEKLLTDPKTKATTQMELKKALESKLPLEHTKRIQDLLTRARVAELRCIALPLIERLGAKKFADRIKAENDLEDLLKDLKKKGDTEGLGIVMGLLRRALYDEVMKQINDQPYNIEIIRRTKALIRIGNDP